MLTLLLLLTTPILGALKNYIKYKKFNIITFSRTPILCTFLFIIMSQFTTTDYSTIFFILILERWVMFIYKILVAYIDDNYIKKKDKYVLKYGFIYC